VQSPRRSVPVGQWVIVRDSACSRSKARMPEGSRVSKRRLYGYLDHFRMGDNLLGERQIQVTGLFGQKWSFLGAKDLHIGDG